jgi:predicted transcriptional regulator
MGPATRTVTFIKQYRLFLYMKKLLHPQEIEVHYIIPALRRALSVALKKEGTDQKTIAKKLGVTESAISQYLSLKRATAIEFNTTMQQAIQAAAHQLQKGSNIVYEMQQLLTLSMKEKVTCKLHIKLSNLPHDCTECFQQNLPPQ